MEEIWYEEALIPPKDSFEELVTEKAYRTHSNPAFVREEFVEKAHGVVRTNQPHWQQLAENQRLVGSLKNSRLYLVRLGFEYEIPREFYDRGTRFTFGRCTAYIRTDENQPPQPKVFDVIPRSLYEGEPRKIAVKFGPNITIGDFGGSLGEISTDITVGQITPAVIGYTGDNECEPYWDLRPITKDLLGLQNLWLVIEVPSECDAFRLSVRAEGDIQTKFGPIAIGPVNHTWASRPSIVIS